jgi:hypothetical protein
MKNKKGIQNVIWYCVYAPLKCQNLRETVFPFVKLYLKDLILTPRGWAFGKGAVTTYYGYVYGFICWRHNGAPTQESGSLPRAVSGRAPSYFHHSRAKVAISSKGLVFSQEERD